MNNPRIKIATIFDKTISVHYEIRIDNEFEQIDFVRLDLMLENKNQTLQELESEAKEKAKELLLKAAQS